MTTTMYLQQTPGFIWLLALIMSHVTPAYWSQQQIPDPEHTAFNSSLREQHVFSGLWLFQHLHKAVYLRHFSKSGRQQIISIHGNNFEDREKYDFSRQQHASSYGIFDYIFQDKASLYECQRNLHDIITSSTGQLDSPRAGPLAQQRRQLILTNDVNTDIA